MEFFQEKKILLIRNLAFQFYLLKMKEILQKNLEGLILNFLSERKKLPGNYVVSGNISVPTHRKSLQDSRSTHLEFASGVLSFSLFSFFLIYHSYIHTRASYLLYLFFLPREHEVYDCPSS